MRLVVLSLFASTVLALLACRQAAPHTSTADDEITAGPHAWLGPPRTGCDDEPPREPELDPILSPTLPLPPPVDAATS